MTQGVDKVLPPLEGEINVIQLSTTATAAIDVGMVEGYVTFICDGDFYFKFGTSGIAPPDPTATDSDIDGAASDGTDRRCMKWPADTPLPLYPTESRRYFRAVVTSGTPLLRRANS